MEPAPSLVSAISEGLLDDELTVTKVRAVEVHHTRRNDRGWPVLFVAARIEGPDTDVVGVWATGALSGPIFAVDAVAREFSTWASAARGGSPMSDLKDRFAGYPEVDQVRRVLEDT